MTALELAKARAIKNLEGKYIILRDIQCTCTYFFLIWYFLIKTMIEIGLCSLVAVGIVKSSVYS